MHMRIFLRGNDTVTRSFFLFLEGGSLIRFSISTVSGMLEQKKNIRTTARKGCRPANGGVFNKCGVFKNYRADIR